MNVFIDNNHGIQNTQFDFRSHHTTTHQLVLLTCYSTEKKLSTQLYTAKHTSNTNYTFKNVPTYLQKINRVIFTLYNIQLTTIC